MDVRRLVIKWACYLPCVLTWHFTGTACTPGYFLINFSSFFFHISPTNKRKNFNSRLSLICFVLGIGIKRFEDKMFMVILKKKVIKDYWLNNISFFIIDCPSRDNSFFLELQYIFSMFCPNKMNFIIQTIRFYVYFAWLKSNIIFKLINIF